MKHTKSDRTRIAERLKAARELAGLSQNQAAKMLGLKRPGISEIEAGRRKVAADELAQLAKIYRVDVSWLIGADDQAEEGQERVELAARELSKLKPEDMDRILNLLSALRNKGKDS